MLGLFANLIRDLSKLEDGIIKKSNSAEDPTDAKITDELLTALTKNLTILTDEPEKGIHAEVQILSKIVEMINAKALRGEQEIYIGISKRCCLNCHSMITAANEILKPSKITIKTRGTHGLDFTWKSPKLFSDGYNGNKKKVDKTTLQYLIGKKAKETFDEYVQLEKSKSEMAASQSDSDFELNLEERGKEKNNLIKQGLILFQQLDQKRTVQETILEINIALKVYETDEFKKLLEQLTSTPPEKEIAKNTFYAIYQHLSELSGASAAAATASSSSSIVLSKAKLLEILKKEAFFGEMVGYFADLKSEDLLDTAQQFAADDISPPLKKLKTNAEPSSSSTEKGNEESEVLRSTDLATRADAVLASFKVPISPTPSSTKPLTPMGLSYNDSLPTPAVGATNAAFQPVNPKLKRTKRKK